MVDLAPTEAPFCNLGWLFPRPLAYPSERELASEAEEIPPLMCELSDLALVSFSISAISLVFYCISLPILLAEKLANRLCIEVSGEPLLWLAP